MRVMPNIWAMVYPGNIPERLRHQAIEEAAYFGWLRRGRLIGDPLTDWLAAEAEAIMGWPVSYYLDSFVRWHHQATEVAAYFRWLGRNQPIGEPLADWFPAEAEAYGLALRWFNLSVSWWSEWIKWPWPV
jgi:Protein of unknown function (DUF2934)